jgi:hypothetical protein
MNRPTPRPSITSTRLFAAMLGLSLFGAGMVDAATFNIADGDTAGLIAAVLTANASGVPNTINLAAQGTYILTSLVQGDDAGYHGPTGLPYIFSPLTINGNGATIQRSTAPGTPHFGILLVYYTSLTLDGVTLTGGDSIASGYSAGGLAIDTSTVVIRNSTLTQNAAANYVGGILNFCGALSVVNSTISYNTGGSGYGGGGILDVSSFCNNPPYFSATTSLSFDTIFENRNTDARGDSIADAFGAPGSISVRNSILASPTRGTGDACYAVVLVSGGHNIASDATCGLSGTGDLSSTDPLLGPTALNGGPTPTDLPALNSPAVDGVPLSYCSDLAGAPVTADQRGVSRPQRSACDIGSVELAGALYHVCLLYDSTKAVKSGATYPIKLDLCDSAGTDRSSSAIAVQAISITQVSTSISGPVEDSGDSSPDSNFRFDATLGSTGGYIFNLKTTGLTTGSYNVNFTVAGDSFVYAAPFQVK